MLSAARLFCLAPIVRASLTVPDLAQIIDQASFNSLPTVTPTYLTNDSLVFQPPGVPEADLVAKPFHIYDEEFLPILGDHPTLTLIAEGGSNPLYHEAVVWNPPTDEVFFVQSAGGTGSGTGLNKSAIIQKISVPQAAAVSHLRNASGLVNVTVVPSAPTVINPNGGTYYKGNILYVTEGQGESVPPALYLMNPQAPYNTTIILNNYFNRQFNSLNDIAVHPVNVWNPAGKLLGKIYMGGLRTANFQFAGKGRLIITAETRLYYATLSASGTRLP